MRFLLFPLLSLALISCSSEGPGTSTDKAATPAPATSAESQAFLDKAAAEPGAIRSRTGLVYRELRPGTGASPKDTDTVKVFYRGTFINGTEFDASKNGQPSVFSLNRVIGCWTEGIMQMKVGGKSKLVCPPSIAYGEGGYPPTIPGNATLVFEVELLGINGA